MKATIIINNTEPSSLSKCLTTTHIPLLRSQGDCLLTMTSLEVFLNRRSLQTSLVNSGSPNHLIRGIPSPDKAIHRAMAASNGSAIPRRNTKETARVILDKITLRRSQNKDNSLCTKLRTLLPKLESENTVNPKRQLPPWGKSTSYKTTRNSLNRK